MFVIFCYDFSFQSVVCSKFDVGAEYGVLVALGKAASKVDCRALTVRDADAVGICEFVGFVGLNICSNLTALFV